MERYKITFKEVNKYCYDILFDNRPLLGQLSIEEDGYFHWFPELTNEGRIDSWVLKEIYLKLEELNKEWNDIINKELND